MRVLACFLVVFMVSCTDTIPPVIEVLPGSGEEHYRGLPYEDPGAIVLDDQSCDTEEMLTVINEVDIWQYGSYTVTYTATDMSNNTATAIREVDILLRPDDYYDLTWNATDTCEGIAFNYTALVQDCDCDSFAITVGNISNFGLSALFTLPLDGSYNELVLMDTTKSGVTFSGNAIMNPSADTLIWTYTLSDGADTESCSATWTKN
jgi:hypothetical protein